MRLEPWYFPPAVVARMTDYEIVCSYVWPQMARMEAAERQRKGLPPLATPGAVEEPGRDFEPSKQYMMTMFVNVLGMTPEAAAAEYDRQKAMNDELKAKRGDGK